MIVQGLSRFPFTRRGTPAQDPRRANQGRLEKDWATNPAGSSSSAVTPPLTSSACVAARPIEHTLAKRGAEKLWKLVNGGAKKGYVNAFGAITAGQSRCSRPRPASKPSTCRAGRSPPTATAQRHHVPGPVAVRVRLGADDGSPHQQHLHAAPTRSSGRRGIDPGDKGFIDYFLPIVADAEAGFGGVLNAFELMKNMIKAGAAGVHFEDQLAAVKKCGHMGGKVLVPTQEAVREADRRALRRRRAGRADHRAGPYRRRSRQPDHLRPRRRTTSRS